MISGVKGSRCALEPELPLQRPHPTDSQMSLAQGSRTPLGTGWSGAAFMGQKLCGGGSHSSKGRDPDPDGNVKAPTVLNVRDYKMLA